MPRIEIVQDHSLTTDEARQRLDALNADLRERFGLVPVWTSPTEARISRAGASGLVRIEPRRIRVLIDLPFALVLLRERIEQLVRSELGELFAT